MKLFGLLGKTLSHSFSKKYFSEKFEHLGLKDHVFELFEIPSIEEFPKLLASKSSITGMNVTIPYKEAVIPYLTSLDDSAKNVGAVNVIKFRPSGELIGYNSDYYGFKQSLLNFSSENNFNLEGISALILGTGGAAKAVMAALNDLKINFKIVSRQKERADLSYDELNTLSSINYNLIINTSPVGTYPNIEECPYIPYDLISDQHLLFDLVYNPEETLFMKTGKDRGALVKNGLEMLHLQAERAWEIWNS